MKRKVTTVGISRDETRRGRYAEQQDDKKGKTFFLPTQCPQDKAGYSAPMHWVMGSIFSICVCLL